MDIQVIVIVGDRSVTDDGDVEWENVVKSETLLTTTADMKQDHNQHHAIVETKFMVQELLLNLIPEYLRRRP